MKQVKVSPKQAQILSAAQNKFAQVNMIAQEAKSQLDAILAIVADVIGVPVQDLVSIDSSTNEVTVLEESDRAQPPAEPQPALPELPHDLVEEEPKHDGN